MSAARPGSPRARRATRVARAACATFGVFAALLLAEAGTAFAHGALVEQIAQITAAIERDPGNGRLYLRRGELHRVHAEWDAALTDFARASVLAPDDDRIEFLRGRALQEAGRPDAARSALDAYLARHPADAAARVARARVLAALGEPRAAADDYAAVLDADPRPDPDLCLERSRAQVAAGDLARAEADLDVAIARLGPVTALQLHAIEIAVRDGRFDAALVRLDAVAARSPRRETWLARRAEIHALAGRPAESRTAYAAALAAIEALPAAARKASATVDLETRVRNALGGDQGVRAEAPTSGRAPAIRSGTP